MNKSVNMERCVRERRPQQHCTRKATETLEKMRGNTNLQMTQLHKRENSKGGLKRNSWLGKYQKSFLCKSESCLEWDKLNSQASAIKLSELCMATVNFIICLLQGTTAIKYKFHLPIQLLNIKISGLTKSNTHVTVKGCNYDKRH